MARTRRRARVGSLCGLGHGAPNGCELALHVGQAAHGAAVFGNHHHVGSLGKKLALQSKALAEQPLDAVAPHGWADFA
jgi:hypothetical protein